MPSGSKTSPGPSSRPSPSRGRTQFPDARTALLNAQNIGQSSAILAHQAASQGGGLCSCVMGSARLEAGARGAWKSISWEPVIFMPYLPSLKALPGRAWMFTGWTDGYLKCVDCGKIVAVVSAELSGVAVVNRLAGMSASTPRKKKQ